MTHGIRTRARSTAVVALVAAGLAWLSPAEPAHAAEGAQTPAPVLKPLSVDASSTKFTFDVGDGAFCDGTGGEGWRAHTFIVDDDFDLSKLNFGSSFPPGAVGTDYDATDGSIMAPLFQGTGGYNFEPAGTPPGLIDPADLAGFDFTLADWKLVDGDYQIGFACTGPSNAQLRQWWSIPVTIDVDGSPFMVANAAAPTPASTTLALTADPANEATEGEEVTLTATVTPTAAAGTVTFEADGFTLGSPVAVDDGVATLPTDDLDVGELELTASFTPTDEDAFTSSTATLDYTVVSADAEETSVTLTVNPASTAAFGESVTITATVAPAEATGSVAVARVQADNHSITVAVLTSTAVEVVDGKASVTVTDLPVGEHVLLASFTPEDPDAYQPSDSDVVEFTVTEAASTTSSSSTSSTATTSTTVGSQVLSGQTSQSGQSGGGRSSLATTGRGVVWVALGLLLIYLGRVALLLARPHDVLTRE